MNEIAEYERRINVALERIGYALESLVPGDTPPQGGADGGAEAAALREALETERAANAQLTERVRAIKEKQETMVAALERKVARLTQQLDVAGHELLRQKRISTQLAESSRALSDSAASGATEPHLINRAMQTELEHLRAMRVTEVAELDEVLGGLQQLIAEAANA